jgi:hypothetical protein
MNWVRTSNTGNLAAYAALFMAASSYWIWLEIDHDRHPKNVALIRRTDLYHALVNDKRFSPDCRGRKEMFCPDR